VRKCLGRSARWRSSSRTEAISSVLEEQRQAEREQQLVVLGGETVRLDDHALDEHADREEQRADDHDGEVGIDPAQREQPVGGVHAEHHHRAVREVDDAQHAEDERQAARHQPVHAAEQEAADGGLEEKLAGNAAQRPSRATW
jgi:hypothetical protein